jgi:NADH-quinone oxidoreductase subunit A
MTSTDNYSLLWPFIIYFGLVIILVVSMVGLSYVLGERHKEKHTDTPFESGIEPTDSARMRFPSHFYLIAMFFVIFDLDALFVFTWAVTFREVGIAGYIGVLIFILILVAVLVYEWGSGALDFGPNGKKILKAMHNRKAASRKS